ncbi:hypothetical protein [Leptolyngbya sp. BC1307]|uniref:hypothetical protein n=1 Tax=Leptolyngbya sp. BC1307 TaxID=2029589 RepID=UPI000EFA4DA9|nr:hypothetical protein [Leptolyngbya sp. BC1307]
MNRYDDTAQTPRASSPLNQFNLTQVRPGLSRSPQTIRADFKVQSSDQVLKIQFSQHRIREALFPVTSESRSWDSVSLGVLTVLCTVVFVGGAVIFTGAVWPGVMVAAVLPIFFGLAVPPIRVQPVRMASLAISRSPDGRTLLSLSTAPLPPRSHLQNSSKSARHLKGTHHLFNMPLRSIKLAPTRWHSLLQGESLSVCLSPLSCQISLTLYEHQSRRINRLRIGGTRHEILWLCNHLSQWGVAIKR